jgi:outer membrane protein assembly factor BamB
MSTCAIKDGLLYTADLSGFLYCLDVRTGEQRWRHDTLSAIWGSPYVVDGKVFLGDEEGDVVVLRHGPELKEISTIDMGNPVYTTPVAANGTLYVSNQRTLYAVAASTGTSGR